MALTVRKQFQPMAFALVTQFNAFVKSFALNNATLAYPHFDTSSVQVASDYTAPSSTPLAVSPTAAQSTLAGVVSQAEATRAVLLQHFPDALAHKAADTVNLALISFATLPPLLPPTLGVPWQVTGTGGTFSAVTAAHTLTLSFTTRGHQPNQVVVSFTGSESSVANFVTTINAALTTSSNSGYAQSNGGQLQLVTNASGGDVMTASIVAGSADVLTNLGLSVGAFAPVATVTQPATQTQANALNVALATAYAAHLSQSGIHAHTDSTNTLSAAASTSLSTSETQASNTATEVNAHICDSPGSILINLIAA
jgi:hypothetical protein